MADPMVGDSAEKTVVVKAVYWVEKLVVYSAEL